MSSATEQATAAVAASTGSSAKASTLFVGNLSPSTTEDMLLEHFKHIGPIISVRVCRDIITKKSLSYSYVNFANAKDAATAIEKLNFSKLDGSEIRVMWQQRDPAMRISGQGNLFVRGFDAEKTDSKALTDMFSTFGPIMSARVMEGRGYGFVHFKDESSASKALKHYAEKPDGISVANFIRRNARLLHIQANFTNVYIKHLLPNVDQAQINRFFSTFGEVNSAVTKQDNKGRIFAFCNFAKHDDAVKAIESVNDKDVDGMSSEGETIYAARAQHRTERMIELRRRFLERSSRGNNLYVRNFDPATFGDNNLRELFKGYGEILSCKVMTDEKGNPRGFGFVSYSTAEEANLALREMNGRMLNGKPLVVNIAQRRDHRLSMLQVQFHQRLQNMMQGGGAGGSIMPPSMFYSATKGFLAGGPSQQQQAGGGAQGFMISPAQQQQMMFMQSGGGGAANRTMMQQQQSAQSGSKKPKGKKQKGGDHQQQQAASSSSAAAAAALPPQASDVPTLDELMKMPVDDRKRTLGERLFPAVLSADVPEEITPKITGMLLELDPADGLSLLTNAKKLKEKIDEALCVLKQSSLA